EALGREADTPAQDSLGLKEDLTALEERVLAIRQRLDAQRPQLAERLASQASQAGWQVLRARNAEEASLQIRQLVQEKGVQRIVRAEYPVFRKLHLHHTLEDLGVRVTPMALGVGGTREGLHREASLAELGLTGVDYAIAETGTCVLIPRRGVSRLVSLLPPLHLALVEPEQMVETLDDLLVLRTLAFYKNKKNNPTLSTYMSFITGPSRTADIEQTLVIGVHGPREVYLLLLGDFSFQE
ncbi:MAG: lactate utilization protein, partial [Dehalococcoidia bacterium]